MGESRAAPAPVSRAYSCRAAEAQLSKGLTLSPCVSLSVSLSRPVSLSLCLSVSLSPYLSVCLSLSLSLYLPPGPDGSSYRWIPSASQTHTHTHTPHTTNVMCSDSLNLKPYALYLMPIPCIPTLYTLTLNPEP